MKNGIPISSESGIYHLQYANQQLAQKPSIFICHLYHFSYNASFSYYIFSLTKTFTSQSLKCPKFSSESPHWKRNFCEKIFWFEQNAIFFMNFFKREKLPPFWHTTRISLLSVTKKLWRRLRNTWPQIQINFREILPGFHRVFCYKLGKCPKDALLHDATT